jgi:hypothetical protein
MRRDAESRKFLGRKRVKQNPKKRARENIKSEKWKPEIKKNGAGHVHAADGEHIGWGDRVCADVAARTNAADDDAQREKEIAGERGDEG